MLYTFAPKCPYSVEVCETTWINEQCYFGEREPYILVILAFVFKLHGMHDFFQTKLSLPLQDDNPSFNLKDCTAS